MTDGFKNVYQHENRIDPPPPMTISVEGTWHPTASLDYFMKTVDTREFRYIPRLWSRRVYVGRMTNIRMKEQGFDGDISEMKMELRPLREVARDVLGHYWRKLRRTP